MIGLNIRLAGYDWFKYKVSWVDGLNIRLAGQDWFEYKVSWVGLV